MSLQMLHLLYAAGIFLVLLIATGIYSILVTRNLIRVLIGLEIMSKAVTLAVIVGGYATKNMAFAQSLAITFIIIEVVVIAVAAGLVVSIYRQHNSLDTATVKLMKG